MAGRAKGHPSAPGGQPRGSSQRPIPARTPVTISDDDRERIERRLGDLPLDRDALLLALKPFGASFDRDAWRKSSELEDEDSAERNKVRLVKSNLQALVDNMVELGRIGVTVTALKPRDRPWHQTNSDIEAVRADGGLTGQESADLIKLKLLADKLRHEYMVEPDESHSAVNLALELLPGFTASYTKWLAGYGIVF
jgi:hypothetical protein